MTITRRGALGAALATPFVRGAGAQERFPNKPINPATSARPSNIPPRAAFGWIGGYPGKKPTKGLIPIHQPRIPPKPPKISSVAPARNV